MRYVDLLPGDVMMDKEMSPHCHPWLVVSVEDGFIVWVNLVTLEKCNTNTLDCNVDSECIILRGDKITKRVDPFYRPIHSDL